MRDGDDNLLELRAALRADAPGVAEALLGVPSKAHSTRDTLRWGGKGSLSLEVRGPKRGLWFSHEGDEGSDLLGLIQHVHGCKFPEALAWARHWTGLETDDDAPYQPRPRPAPPPPPDPAEDAEAAAALAERIATAQRIAAGSVPAVAGTPANWYLMQARGIPRPPAGWPDAIRWHPIYRALVAVATLADGTVQAVQRVHLGQDGGKASADEVQARRLRAVKITNGVGDGAAVRLPGDPDGPLLLVEGPETGLAAWASTGHETWIALGAIGKLQPPAGRRVVVVSDDNPPAHDAKQGGAAKALRKALAAWRKAGVNLVLATPWEARRHDKSDMADLILAHGPDAVRKRIQAALEPGRAAVERLPLAEAERAVAMAVGAFSDRVDRLSVARVEWDRKAAAATAGSLPVEGDDMPPTPPPAEADPAPMSADDWADALALPVAPPDLDTFTHGVRVTVGVGKSHAARQETGRVLAAMRARGDTRTHVIAVPAHALGDEQAAAWRVLPSVKAAGLQVATWRGRSAPDPAAPGYADPEVSRENKVPMCRDLERVSDVHAVGLSAQTAACKTSIKNSDGTRRTVKCPKFDTCAYQAQTKVRADLWLVAHSALFHTKPAALGEVAAVIVDEEAWRTGLIGAEGRHITLTVDALASDILGALVGVNRDRLRDLRRQLVAALDKMPAGPVQRDAFKSSRLTASSAAEGRALEWERKLDTKAIHPGLTRDERREAMEALDANRTVARCAMVWDALAALLADDGPAASGWLALDVETTRDGPTRVLRLKARAEVASGWKAPTLLLDALLPVELVRPFWPDLQLVADVQAAMPHQHVHQVTDKAYALSMLEPLAPLGKEAATADPEAAERRLKEMQRRQNRLRELRAVLVREAVRWAPGQVLVVAQKAVKEALLKLGGLPGNIALAHHNAIAGRDEWRDAAAVIVIGRTLPSPAAVERITEALTGEAVPALAGWYERSDAVRQMADGSTVQADADRHPHPIAEMVRWQVAEGQLVQIVGRGRGVRRTEANPLHILALTDAPLPMPLAGILDAADVEPGPADLMLAEGGIVFENARHAAAAYPDLWPSHKAAGKAMERARSATFPYRYTSIGKCRTPRQAGAGLIEVAYQVAGAGQKPAKAAADLMLCPDPASFLTARFLTAGLGALAWCKVGEVPPPEPPEPPAPEPPTPDPDPPAPRPPPPPPPAADDAGGDDEPPPGHPARDRPPVEEPDGWEPADWDGGLPVGLDWDKPIPALPPLHDAPWLYPWVAAGAAAGGDFGARGGGAGPPQTPRARAVAENNSLNNDLSALSHKYESETIMPYQEAPDGVQRRLPDAPLGAGGGVLSGVPQGPCDGLPVQPRLLACEMLWLHPKVPTSLPSPFHLP